MAARRISTRILRDARRGKLPSHGEAAAFRLALMTELGGSLFAPRSRHAAAYRPAAQRANAGCSKRSGAIPAGIPCATARSRRL